MNELVFLLEEESAKAMLEGLLPRILTDEFSIRYIVFEGKQDLEKQVIKRIKNYRNAEARFVVIRDQDSHPKCTQLKSYLLALCARSGKQKILIRIACRELESFYLADLRAVEKGLALSGLSRQQKKQKFRNPDYLVSPSTELKALTKGLYQKVSGSRAISPWLLPDNTRSDSFRNLVNGIRRFVTTAA